MALWADATLPLERRGAKNGALAARALLALALAAVGCSGEDSTRVGSTGLGAPLDEDSEVMTPEGATEQGPYMGSLRINSPEAVSSYTAIVPVVDAATDARLRAGYETSGVVPSTYQGFLYMPGGAEPTMTKYAVSATGEFTEVGKMSFGAFGVANVGTGPVIGVNMVAPDKAYLLDDANQQLIVWNPETMELTGTVVDLAPALAVEGLDAWRPQIFLSGAPGFARQRGNLLFVPVSWRNFDAYELFAPTAGLLVIDVETDRVVHLLRDERLADSIYTVVTEAGDLYLFSGALGISHQRVRGTAAPGGALRVRSGEDTFDPDYFIDLNAAVGNRPASTPVWAGGSSVYLKAYHEERSPITASIEANPNALIGLQAWRYWKVDLEGAEPAREMTELPWTSTDGFFYRIEEEDRLFLGVMTADFSRTTLYEATDTGFRPSVDVTGTLTVLSLLGRTR
jgi:hypothetical protein